MIEAWANNAIELAAKKCHALRSSNGCATVVCRSTQSLGGIAEIQND
jgi:hypothetical protein